MPGATPRQYLPSDYDGYFCLKPPMLLWIAILYLSRALTLPLLAALGHVAGVDPGALLSMKRLWGADEALIPSIVAAFLLYSLFRRVPQASSAVRWIWAQGVPILGFSAGLGLVLSVIAAARVGEINDQALASIMTAALDGYFLIYILASKRVRDSFSEFPPP